MNCYGAHAHPSLTPLFSCMPLNHELLITCSPSSSPFPLNLCMLLDWLICVIEIKIYSLPNLLLQFVFTLVLSLLDMTPPVAAQTAVVCLFQSDTPMYATLSVTQNPPMTLHCCGPSSLLPPSLKSFMIKDRYFQELHRVTCMAVG